LVAFAVNTAGELGMRVRIAVVRPIVLLFLVGMLAIPVAVVDAANPNWPNDPDEDPREQLPDDPGFTGRWFLHSYIPDECLDTIRPEEIPLGAGIHADRAWQVTLGSPNVVIAVTDSGVYWSDRDLRNKMFLNRGELPLPEGSEVYDANGDGAFDMRDYDADSRVVDVNANGITDAGDLILLFSDGLDTDANGYPDDICGWDFFRHDNDAYDDTGFGHGNGQARLAAGEANNGMGDTGVCPRCQILPIRVSDSYVADVNHFAQAVVFAVDSGAKVVNEALGSINNTPFAREAVAYALAHDVSFAASAADENSFHHNFPATYNRTVHVNAVIADRDWDEVTSFMALDTCTNWGPKITISAASPCCSSCATGVLGGALGQIYSRGEEIGLSPPLSAAEVFALVTRGADDVYNPEGAWNPFIYPSLPGWDKFFGHGRLNVRAAVDLVTPTTIPPEAYVESPEWFEIINPAVGLIPIVGYADARRADSFRYALEAQSGVDPEADAWIPVAEETDLTGPVDGELGAFDPASLPEPKAIRRDVTGHHAVLIRLTVTDSFGNQARYYHQFFLYHDPDAAPGFPKYLKSSGEASPLLADLNGDAAFELIVAAADGLVHAFQGGGGELPGWPVATDLTPGQTVDGLNYRGSAAYQGGELPADWQQAVMGAPAAGDLDGDGTREVVVGTVDGALYVWGADGQLRDGFPVWMDPSHQFPRDFEVDYGFLGAPVLVNLDPPGDGTLEIVAAAMDQYVYAWRADGSPVAGWPVLCRDTSGQGTRISATPAVADLNGDHRYEIVIGTAERYDDTGRLYAIWADGNNHPRGPFLPGWPAAVPGFELDYLPYFGTGIPTSAAIADFDGDGADEIAINAGVFTPLLYDGKGTIIRKMSPWVFSFFAGTLDPLIGVLNANFSIGDIDNSGRLALIKSGLGLMQALQMMYPGLRIPADALIGAWYGDSGDSLRHFPQPLEDIQFIAANSIADITGDGVPEVIGGSGGYYVHAYDGFGRVPDGWPKFVGGWIISSPAVGDLDGDGYLEVAAITREGMLFVWTTAGPADGNRQWTSFQHDPQHTGNYRWPLPSQPGPDDDDDDNNDDDDNDNDDNNNDDNDNDDTSPGDDDDDNDDNDDDDDDNDDAEPTADDDDDSGSCGC
jgi:hypothetical protein